MGEPPQKKVQADVKAILTKGSKEERRAFLVEATVEDMPMIREYHDIRNLIIVKDAEDILMYCEHLPRLGWSEGLADMLPRHVLSTAYSSEADFEKNDEILANAFLALPLDALKFDSIWSRTFEARFKCQLVLLCRHLKEHRPQGYSKYGPFDDATLQLIRENPVCTELVLDAVMKDLTTNCYGLPFYCRLMPFGPLPNPTQSEGEKFVIASLLQCDFACYEDCFRRYPTLPKDSPVRRFIYHTALIFLWDHHDRHKKKNPQVFTEYRELMLKDSATFTRFLLASGNFQFNASRAFILHYQNHIDLLIAGGDGSKTALRSAFNIFAGTFHWDEKNNRFGEGDGGTAVMDYFKKFLNEASPCLINKICFERSIPLLVAIENVESKERLMFLLHNSAFAGLPGWEETFQTRPCL